MTLEAGRTLGHYRIVRMVGAGGMGEVYEAEDLRLGRSVALKRLPRELAEDEERLRRFVTEARALASLNHPNIVTVHAVEECDGEHFFVMELVAGTTLGDMIPPGGMELPRLSSLAASLADALAAAHERGVVHRDLKPANVMIAADGRLKVLDFGLARLALPADASSRAPTAAMDLTRPGTLMGTWDYMAPEQYAGAPADARSDVYAMGVIFFEMATGRRPYTGASPASLMHAVLHEDHPPIGSLRAGTPKELEALIESCLAREPGRRPSSAAVVRERLARVGFDRDAGPASGGPWTRQEPAPPSVAVLPFADMSPGQDQQYLCDGLAEEILNVLAKVKGLSVAARTSSFAFRGKLEDVREIGRRLDVDAVLEGSVRKAGERLRITVQLIKVSDGYHLWSERFDRTDEDIFAVQDEIALAVAEKLKGKLLGSEREALTRRYTEDREAFNLYLRGRYFMDRRSEGDLQRALAHYRQAIDRDPAYVLPYVAVANVYVMFGLWGFMPAGECFGQAKAMAAKALEIDETCAEAHLAMGLVYFVFEWRDDLAERHLNQSLELDISGFQKAWYAFWLVTQGRQEGALRCIRRGVEVEPLSTASLTVCGAACLRLGLVDEAIPLLRRALDLDPHLPTAQVWLGACLLTKGQLEEAGSLFDEAIQSGFAFVWSWRALLAARRDGVRAAREVCEEMEHLAKSRFLPADCRAMAWAAAEEKEKALALLEESCRNHEASFRLLALNPFWQATFPSWYWEAMLGLREQEMKRVKGEG